MLKRFLLYISLLLPYCSHAQKSVAVNNAAETGPGNALVLDGKNQFVDCGNIKELMGTRAFTLEAWIKVRNYTLFGTIICNQGTNPNERIHLALSGWEQGGVSNIVFVVGDDGVNNANYNTTSNLINIEQWIHIAASFDGTQAGDTNKIKIYINGKQQYNLKYLGNGVVPAITNNNKNPFLIGARGNHGLFFDGQIDEVRIWNTVRTKTEIRENMHLSLKGSEKGLVAYYQFDEKDGDVTDPINDYNGTLRYNAKRQPSNLLLGTGVSKTVSIIQKGDYQFDATNCSLDFPDTSPNGEVTVTRLDGKTDGEIDGVMLKSKNIYDKHYWIIHSYGDNQAVKYLPSFNIEKNSISKEDEQQPGSFLLNSKTEIPLTKWQFRKGIKAITATGLLKFDTLQQFGTFIISSNGTSELQTAKPAPNLKWLIGAGLLLLSVIGFLLYRSNKRRQKISEELTAEKKITEIQTGENLLLVHEIHHRVKNNLTMLKSLLYLQAKASAQPETKQILTEVQARVQSMALVHQNLYDGNETGKLNFPAFINKLFGELYNSWFDKSKEINFSVTGTCKELDIETAIPLALIMNELATNSFKYSFNSTDNGEIKTMITETQNTLQIIYSDNGPGLQQGFDLAKGGFGFRVLNILTQQLNASINYQKTATASVFTITLQV